MTHIFSVYPATHDSVASFLDMVRESRSAQVAYEDYPALPWPLEELAGTQWRNVTTATLRRVEGLLPNRWGQPVAFDPAMVSDWDGIGFWWGDKRYCISNYVRVDHLAPEIQLDWYLQRVLMIRYYWEQGDAVVVLRAGRHRMGRGKGALEPEELREAQVLMRSFAQAHGLQEPDLDQASLVLPWRESRPQMEAGDHQDKAHPVVAQQHLW